MSSPAVILTVNPVSVIVLLSTTGTPTSGTFVSLYIFIVLLTDLFPALSIAFTVTVYSPSVTTFITLFISSTLVCLVVI